MHTIDSHRPLILVVDDAPDSIEPIVNCLHKADFRTRIATRGERALQLAASTPVPDLILLDVTMPDMDGYEVCSRLMNNPATASIPVIFLSIRNEELDEQRGFDAGAVLVVPAGAASTPGAPAYLRRRSSWLAWSSVSIR